MSKKALVWSAVMLVALAACKSSKESPPGAVTGVTAVAGNGTVTVSWDAVAGASSYTIYWATSAGVTTASGTAIPNATSPHGHTGLANGTTYYYVVTATGKGGEGPASAEVSARPLPPLAGKPASIAQTGGTKNSNTIEWGVAADADSYTIYWSNAAGVTPANGTPIPNATSPYTHSGLIPGETYYYIVVGVNLSGEGTASDEVSRTTDPSSPAVAALYPTSGANWNDYVKNDGANRLLATDVACDGAATQGGFGSCIHGGEMRAVAVEGRTSCDGLTASDVLGAFDWVCDPNANPVRMVSLGLKPGVRLADLIDSTGTQRFLNNQVTVLKGTITVAATAGAQWWENGVSVIDDVTFPTANAALTSGPIGQIWRTGASIAKNLSIAADKVAVVVGPGHVVSASTTSALTANTKAFLWIEGRFNGTGVASGLDGLSLVAVKHSVLRGVAVQGATRGNMAAIYVTGANDLLDDVIVARSSYGLYAGSLTFSTLNGVRAFNNAQHGIYLAGATNSTLSLATASSNGATGLRVENGGTAGAANSGAFLGVTATLNGGNGLFLQNAGNLDVSSAVAANNGSRGFDLQTVTASALSNLASASNGTIGYNLATCSNNVFTGRLLVNANNQECNISGTSPGLVEGTGGICEAPAVNTPSVVANLAVTSSFAGKVITTDAVNPTNTNGLSAFGSITDWVDFENASRGWGVDGSAFPNADQRGNCTNGTCRIWDWSLAAADTVLRAPGGASILGTHVWSLAAVPAAQTDCDAAAPGSVWNGTDACETAFVATAVEIIGDGWGNDNGLCEAAELCVELVDDGAYQGHGALALAGTVTVGSGAANLYRYAANGR